MNPTNNFIYIVDAYSIIVEATKLAHSKLDQPYRSYIEIDTQNQGLPLNEKLYTPLFYIGAHRAGNTYQISFAINKRDPLGAIYESMLRDLVRKFTSEAHCGFNLSNAVQEIDYSSNSYAGAFAQFNAGNRAYQPIQL